MEISVSPGPIKETVAAIPSKSHVHRLLIAAALSESETNIRCESAPGNVLSENILSGDILATAESLRALCADVKEAKGGFLVTPRKTASEAILPCGESGSTYRFLLPVCCALGVKARFSLKGRLPMRPMDALFGQLRAHGMIVCGEGTDLPGVQGKLRGGHFSLPGDVSSQFISGLCFALPLTEEGGEIAIQGPLESSGYVQMTLKAIRAFGIRATFCENHIRIPGKQRYCSPGDALAEGDWSAAAFWLCAAACGGDACVTGLRTDSAQGDRKIAEILREMGARVETFNNAIRVQSAELVGVEVDIRDTPDLAPALAVAALAAKGETALTGIKRLRLKESDRVESIVGALRDLGADIRAENDSIQIRGGKRLRGGSVSARGDHRIAMMLGCAATLCDGPVTILGAEAVQKSYPAFFADLQTLGGERN